MLGCEFSGYDNVCLIKQCWMCVDFGYPILDVFLVETHNQHGGVKNKLHYNEDDELHRRNQNKIKWPLLSYVSFVFGVAAKLGIVIRKMF